MKMTSKQRMIAAIDGGVPDRFPVTTHHVIPFFLRKYMDGISYGEFFDHFGLDPILWTSPYKPDESKGEYNDPTHDSDQARRTCSDNWRVECEPVPCDEYPTTRYKLITPDGTLTTVLQSNEYTTWITEHLIKEKGDIDIIGKYVTAPKCDVEVVNREAEEFGDRGLVRGTVCSFDIYGQPGTWQDAACLVGIEKLILETYDDPQWVHELLKILQARKKVYMQSLKGAKYDILELGGGDASSTVISPKMFDEFVAPYDSELIAIAHSNGQKIVYHTCGGMMPILENIAAMNPDAMETFTPLGLGGDAELAEARRRIPDNICMIGGFDQFHFFKDCDVEQTRTEVRRCFEAAGKNGSYILSPSDHFFNADPELIEAFADEARKCVY